MSTSKYVLLLIAVLIPTTAIRGQQKAGTLKIRPYTFENERKE